MFAWFNSKPVAHRFAATGVEEFLRLDRAGTSKNRTLFFLLLYLLEKPKPALTEFGHILRDTNVGVVLFTVRTYRFIIAFCIIYSNVPFPSYSSLQQNRWSLQTRTATTCWWVTLRATSTSTTWWGYVAGTLQADIWFKGEVLYVKYSVVLLTNREQWHKSPLENGKSLTFWKSLQIVCKLLWLWFGLNYLTICLNRFLTFHWNTCLTNVWTPQIFFQ